MIDSSFNLIIPGTDVSPTISYNASAGAYLIAGRSMPEDSVEFYERILRWFEDWHKEILNEAGQPTSVREHAFTFDMEYYNSASGKYIFQMIEEIDKAHVAIDALSGNPTVQIKLIWLYGEDDEFMHEAGEDMQDVTEIEIEIKTR